MIDAVAEKLSCVAQLALKDRGDVVIWCCKLRTKFLMEAPANYKAIYCTNVGTLQKCNFA